MASLGGTNTEYRGCCEHHGQLVVSIGTSKGNASNNTEYREFN